MKYLNLEICYNNWCGA